METGAIVVPLGYPRRIMLPGMRSPEVPMTLATRDLEYTDKGTTLDGVVLDEGRTDQRPGVLLIHGGAGLDDHARGQALRYAELGYVVLACDMYGRGVAGDRERVMSTLMGLRDNPDRLAQRAAAGLAALRGLSRRRVS
jgi:dienelactone hydrolase